MLLLLSCFSWNSIHVKQTQATNKTVRRNGRWHLTPGSNVWLYHVPATLIIVWTTSNIYNTLYIISTLNYNAICFTLIFSKSALSNMSRYYRYLDIVMIARVIYLVLGKSVRYVSGSQPIICSNVATPTSYGEMTPSWLKQYQLRQELIWYKSTYFEKYQKKSILFFVWKFQLDQYLIEKCNLNWNSIRET